MPTYKTAKDIKVTDVSTSDGLALIIDLNGVVVEAGWEHALNEALGMEQRRVRGRFDYDYYIRRVGTVFTVTCDSDAVSAKKAVKVLREVVKVAPKLNFRVGSVDNEDGSTTITVYYDGQLSCRGGVVLPSTPAGVYVEHDSHLHKVIITLANPLFSLPEDFVTKVQAALQAESVNPTTNQ